MKLFDRVSEKEKTDRQWMLKRAFTPSIAVATTTQAPVSGNVDVEEFFVFSCKRCNLNSTQLRYACEIIFQNGCHSHSRSAIALSLLGLCYWLADELMRKESKRVLLELQEFKLFRLFFCVEYFHVFILLRDLSHTHNRCLSFLPWWI